MGQLAVIWINAFDLEDEYYCQRVRKSGILYLTFKCILSPAIDHFTVSCLVAWPLNESEAGGDLVLIETSLLF